MRGPEFRASFFLSICQLNNFAVRQISHERQIGFQKVKGGELIPFCPSDFAKNPVFDLTTIAQHREES
jgi:hypothetical protein